MTHVQPFRYRLVTDRQTDGWILGHSIYRASTINKKFQVIWERHKLAIDYSGVPHILEAAQTLPVLN